MLPQASQTDIRQSLDRAEELVDLGMCQKIEAPIRVELGQLDEGLGLGIGAEFALEEIAKHHRVTLAAHDPLELEPRIIGDRVPQIEPVPVWIDGPVKRTELRGLILDEVKPSPPLAQVAQVIGQTWTAADASPLAIIQIHDRL